MVACVIVAPLFCRQARMSHQIKFPPEAVAAKLGDERLLAIKLVREANPGMGLREAMDAVDAHDPRQHGFVVGPTSTATNGNGLPAEAIAALSRGQVVEAVKIVRDKTGLGLKESKDMVDAYRDGEVPPRDEAMRARLESIAGKHGFKVPEEAMTAMERGDLKTALERLRQAKDASPQTALHAGHASRATSTVSRETSRNGWVWILLFAAAIAAAGFWFGR